MKFTSEDLMKAMGLSVGDIVKVEGYSQTFEITKSHEDIIRLVADDTSLVHINWLVDKNFEIIPRQKRVGDLKCGEYGKQNCGSCPIRAICVSDEYNNDTLYEKLELSHKYAKDQEIYDLLKARLDKEVE